jgi:hypothetical protein
MLDTSIIRVKDIKDSEKKYTIDKDKKKQAIFLFNNKY